MALRPGEQPNLVYREVHPFFLFRLDALYSPYGIVRNDALVVCLVATGTQLVEIGNLAVPGERSVLYSVPAVLRPRTRLVFEVVLEAQDKLPVDVFPFERSVSVRILAGVSDRSSNFPNSPCSRS